MRQKFVFMTAVFVCLALVATPMFAAERTADRAGDRTKVNQTQRGVESGASAMRGGYMQHAPLGVKEGDGRAAAEAMSKLSAAANLTGDDAIGTLNQILRMDLPAGPQTDKIMTATYNRLGNL